MTAAATKMTKAAIDEAAAWAAVEARDERADGAFVYAVVTTRIYCRPTCPARRPRREHAAFYATPDDAEGAGYRACRRCRPRAASAPGGARHAERARALIDQRLAAAPSARVTLAELAAATGLSAFHLQRTFKRVVGLTPAEYVRARRGERLRRELRAGETVSGAAYGAGFGSSNQAYGAGAALGMTPGAYRRGGRGVHVRYVVVECPLGTLLVAATERGVCAVTLGDSAAELEAALAGEYPQATRERVRAGDGGKLPAGSLGEWTGAILEYLAGRATALAVPTDARGTGFQRRVWDALALIPHGETRSYQEVAAALGAPRAVRAVAGACARNPVALVVPCHRVLRTGGALGGYRWGLERKRALLAREKAAGERDDG